MLYDSVSVDSAYPLRRQLIIPYMSRQQLPDDKRQFNAIHSSSRIKVEHAFGLLTSRWRFLWKHLYMYNVERMAKTIVACCALHNICIDQNSIEDSYNDEDMDYPGFARSTQLRAASNPIRFSELPQTHQREFHS